MGHSLISNHVHLIFATKYRDKSLTPIIRERLWKVMHGIMRKNNIGAVAIGGYDDHCHVLLSLPSSISMSEAAKILKGTSSKWLSDTYPELYSFSWQKGYAGFAVSYSNVPKVITYINNQESHHQQSDFKEEYIGFLQKHQLPINEDSIFD